MIEELTKMDFRLWVINVKKNFLAFICVGFLLFLPFFCCSSQTAKKTVSEKTSTAVISTEEVEKLINDYEKKEGIKIYPYRRELITKKIETEKATAERAKKIIKELADQAPKK
mgnify:CR=1 FL=1